jgi:hypothetical protein
VVLTAIAQLLKDGTHNYLIAGIDAFRISKYTVIVGGSLQMFMRFGRAC